MNGNRNHIGRRWSPTVAKAELEADCQQWGKNPADYKAVITIWQEVNLRDGYRRYMGKFQTIEAAKQWAARQPKYLKAQAHETNK